jgi:CRP-like cAMP-binding protein
VRITPAFRCDVRPRPSLRPALAQYARSRFGPGRMNITPDDLQALAALYPALAAIPADSRAADLQQAAWLDVPTGTTLFEEQAPCRGFPLVLSGEVRVARGSSQGR